MGNLFDKGCVRNSIRSLNTPSDNPNLKLRNSEDTSRNSSFKTAAFSEKRVNKKPIKFSDSYFIKFLESMDDNNKSGLLAEDLENVDAKRQAFASSPYLKSKMTKMDISKIYKIGKCLGTGQFGSVRIGRPFSDLDKKFAIKSVPRKANEDYIRQIEKEFIILKDVDHPNIIKFYEAYQDQKYFHFVIEYGDGGELFDVISKRGSFCEADAVKIARKLGSAIAHLHDLDIGHRDLKPENILFSNKSKYAEIKLIDFGLSTYVRKDRTMKTRVGTPFYVAPEVLQGEYTKSGDMWSIGVIAYLLLCGYPPFNGDNNNEIFNKIEAGVFTFPKQEWDAASKSAKDFIKRLLVKDTKKRMTPVEALNHPWLTSKSDKKIRKTEVINRLKQFQAPRRIQTDFLLFLADVLEEEQMKKILESLSAYLSIQQLQHNDANATFENYDTDGSSLIDTEELKHALNEVVNEKRTEEILNKWMLMLCSDSKVLSTESEKSIENGGLNHIESGADHSGGKDADPEIQS